MIPPDAPLFSLDDPEGRKFNGDCGFSDGAVARGPYFTAPIVNPATNRSRK